MALPQRVAMMVLWQDGSRQKMVFNTKQALKREARSIQTEGRGIVISSWIESEKNYEELREMWYPSQSGAIVPDLS